MSRLIVLLAIAVLASTAMAVLAGCDSASPIDQPVAAPTETTAPPVATATPAATVNEPASTPTPVPTADEGLEFVPIDSSGASRKQEPVGVVDRDSPKGNSADSNGLVQGDAYTWEDGDRTLTAYLQEDLVIEKGSGGLVPDIAQASEVGANTVRSADSQSKSNVLPVFRSESGELMTLPGGILLVLNAEWTTAEVNSFLSSNGIKMDRVSELSYAVNGFFVDTDPGFPSLELANTLAGQEGVELSSPNWGREASAK